MHHILKAAILAFAFCHLSAVAQETSPGMVHTYDALADTILSVKRAEAGFVQALLESYLQAAQSDYERQDYEGAAANMALFSNEGDNAIAGIRKRLVDEGHHHHHAADDNTETYDQGFVIVDKAHKASLLAAAAQMRQAKKKAAAKAAWLSFRDTAGVLLTTK